MPAKRQSGFTLLELMITLSVAAILSVLAYPSMRDFIRRNRAVEQSNGMQANLQYARGQAAATRSYVSICPLTAAGGTVCDTTDGNYGNGWLIYTAVAPNTAYTAATGYNVEQTIAAGLTNTLITALIRPEHLRYNSLGRIAGRWYTHQRQLLYTYAENTDGTALNTTAVPGIQLAAANSGRIASTQLAAGGTCP